MENKKDIVNIQTHTDPIKEGSYYEMLSNRLQKLSSAVYLATAHISDTDPIKWRMRAISISLMSDVLRSQFVSFSERQTLVKFIGNSIREMMSLIDIASKGKVVSDKNGDIIRVAFKSFLDALETAGRVRGETEELVSAILKEENIQKDISKGHTQTHEYQQKHTPIKTGFTRVSDHTNRKKEIVDIIKRKGIVGIKDISSLIKDISEKTIQRELNTLVFERVIKKTGEKRWSRYSIL